MPNGIDVPPLEAIERGLDRIAARLERIDDRLAEVLAVALTALAKLDGSADVLRLGNDLVYIGEDDCYHVISDARKRKADREEREPRGREIESSLDPQGVENEKNKRGDDKD